MLILADEHWVLEGDYSYRYFPQSFWGVGPFTSDDDEMKFFYRRIFLKQSLLREVLPRVFVGPHFRWFKYFRLRYEDLTGNPISPPPLTGADDFYATGMGAILRWDERNSVSTPTEGHLINVSFMTNPATYSSLDTYTTYSFDGRKYVDLWGEGISVVAFHLRSDFTAGDPPFQDMAALGGATILRGYYQGRYVDRHGAQVQAEWRQHIFWRLGIAGFAAAGQVWPSFNQIPWDETKISYGGGIRYNINKKDPTNIRIDYGIGEHSTGLYITIGEAF